MKEETDKKKKGEDQVTKVSVARPVVEKTFSFEQWAKLKKIPEHHLKGMRAFLGDKVSYKYPMTKWDEIFKSY